MVARVQGLQIAYAGLGNIPSRGGAVVAVNHTGYLDFLPMALAARGAQRRVRLMAKAEFADNAVLGVLMRGCGVIPVDRSAGADSYAAAVTALRGGDLVAVYPESTISRSFELETFKSGAARMALDAGVPIVPMIVWGAQRIASKGVPRSIGRHRYPIAVGVGDPIPPIGDPRALTGTLRRAMRSVLDEVQSGFDHPAGAPWVPARLGGSAPAPSCEDIRGTEHVDGSPGPGPGTMDGCAHPDPDSSPPMSTER
nr:lysophospholipid acyltransferase family protein [Rhodococcus rhodnii]